jgi:ABC-type lipoprotein release transport system permease subunit
MKTIFVLAWRNIWRNKLRTGVLVSSIAVGIWAGTFVMAFAFGLNRQRTDGAIRTVLSHIQLHDSNYRNDPALVHRIAQGQAVLQNLESNPDVAAVTYRWITDGMVQSSYAAGGIRLMGVDPAREARVTDVAQRLVEGEWLNPEQSKGMVMGEALAKKLQVGLKSKVVITFQDEQGNLHAASFRIAGLYRTQNARLDELNVFVNAPAVWKLVGYEDAFHELALVTTGPDPSALKPALEAAHPALTVETWRDLAPELSYADEVMEQLLYLFVGIILMALAFGLINSLLMSILERTRELGMMKAVGMNARRLFTMILAESLLTSLAGGPIGLLLAYLTIQYLGRTGISFEAFATGLQSFGLDVVTYPTLPTKYYWGIAAMVFVTALLASIAPARRALALKPVEALRHT